MSVCVDLIGRLGNNLFQIAMAVGYAEKHGVAFDIPAWDYSDCFKTPFTSQSTGTTFVGEDGFQYQEFPFIKDVKFFGFFQSWKYFSHCEAKIRELFQFHERIQNAVNKKYTPIFEKLIANFPLGLNICGIHVRRGDYLGNHRHEVCHLEYYQDAIVEMKARAQVDMFFVFSDDMEWCKDNFIDGPFFFVEGNSNIEDLFLMSQCTHNIICNSSFSWWGAWLNSNPQKVVVAPDKWFGEEIPTQDLLPTEWIKIKIK